MADSGKCVFPVKFDLESAVKTASGDVVKVLRQLQTEINSRPLTINPTISDSGLKAMTDKLANLKIPRASVGSGKNMFVAAEGSINALSAAMDKCIKDWNKLAESERIVNRESGEYTEKAQAIIDRFGALTAASRTYAKNLSELQRAADKSVEAEEKKIAAQQKAVAKSKQMVEILNAEELSLSAVAAKRKIYQDIASRHSFTSKEYSYATEQLKRLEAQYLRLQEVFNKNTGGKGKDTVGMERIKNTILYGAESTIEQVQAKIKSLDKLMAKTPFGSKSWDNQAQEASRLLGLLNEMKTAKKEATKTEAQLTAEREAAARAEMENQRKIKAARAQSNAEIERERAARQTLIAQKRQEMALLQQEPKTISEANAQLQIRQRLMNQKAVGSDAWKRQAQEVSTLTAKITQMQAVQQSELAQLQREYTVVKQLISALQGYGSTIGQIQARLSAFQSTLNSTTVGGAAFREAAYQIKMMNEELNKANQLVQNYQAKSLEGVGKKNTEARVREMEDLQRRIREIDAQMNRLHAKGQLTDTSGNVSSQANTLLQERVNLESKLQQMMTSGADVAKKRLDEEIAARQKAIEAANKENQANQAAANLSRRNYEQKKQEGLEMQRILNSQTMSYDALTQKLSALESLRNRTQVGTQRWDKTTKAIEETRAKLAQVTEEMNKMSRRSERLARLREILALNERSVAGLNARLQEHLSILQKMDSGAISLASADAFTRQGLKVARLSEELQRVNQYMADFQAKALQGVRGDLAESAISNLRALRAQIEWIDTQLNNHTQSVMSGRGGTMSNNQVNALLDERIAKQKEIDKITQTAEQQALERERQITAEIEKQRKKTEERNKALQRQTSRKNLLGSSSKDIDTLTKKLQYYQDRLNRIDSTSAPKTFEKIAMEVKKLTKELDEARRKMAELTGQSTSGTSMQARNARNVNQEYSKQLGYVDRLIRRMMVYGSVGMISNFLTKVREETAQFELQKVSLGAILQDQNKANHLFSEIKNLALKSPVSILDLTKYTKQLAAYKIGYDELFETTKKLTDVSVGLGVSMDRVVLAYGQVRATGYLRASEIRQFTEMGVPIVEELAAKLSKMNGELVTAANVMDMVSKRGISFELVKEVFDDMTSAGGIFYNMQERQGNTLYGMWAKLGDAASVMYSEIGNTGIVNDGMKSLINSITWLMRNWRGMIGEIGVAALGLGAYKLVQSLTTVNMIAASKATRDYARAQVQLAVATKNGNMMQKWSASYALRAAAANRAAAVSTNIWTAAKFRLAGAVNSLKAALVGNWLTLAITAFAAITMAIAAAYEKSTRLNRELGKIKEEMSTLQAQSTRNFEYLVRQALSSAVGSKQQKDALDELNRTYKDILPEETLRIENLKKLIDKNGETTASYDKLTQAIRENIAVQQEQKAIEEIDNTEGQVQIDMQKKIRDVMLDKGISETEISRFFIEFRKAAQDTSKTVRQQFEQAWRAIGGDLDKAIPVWKALLGDFKSFFVVGPGIFGTEDQNVRAKTSIGELSRSYAEQEQRIIAVREAYKQSTADLGEYNKTMEAHKQKVQSQIGYDDTLLQDQQNKNMQIKEMENSIREAMQEVGIAWNEGWSNIVKSVDPNDLHKISSLNMDAIISAIDPNKHANLWKYIDAYRNEYNNLVPPDATVQQIRAKLFAIAESTGANVNIMRRFLWDGKTSVDDHLKALNSQIEEYEAKLKKMQTTFANSGMFGTIASIFLKGDIEETTKVIEALKKQAEFVKTYTVPKDDQNKGRKSTNDTRLQELQEINQTLEKINKEYSDLQKAEGSTKAMEDLKKQFESTLAYTNKLGKKFKLQFDYPIDFRSLQQYRGEILKVMKTLEKLKGGKKAILEFETMIAKADSDELQKQIEKQLKDLQEKISRTKIAKEFYDKILAQTGNEELAIKITYAVYPETGKDLYTDMQEQIRRIFDTGDPDKNAKLKLRLDTVFDDANERINYRELDTVYAEFQNDIIEKNRDTAKKLIAEGQKTAAENIATWEKELAKAKDFEEQRTDIINRETQRRIDIYKSNLPQEEKERQAQLSRDKQSSELADLDVKEFKGSDDFVKMFENMENKATASLKRMREEIKQVIENDKDMSPENMKTMVESLEKIDDELTGRNPIGDMTSGMKEMFAAIKKLKEAKTELKSAKAEYKAAEPGLDADISTAKSEKDKADSETLVAERELLAIQQQLAELRAQEIVDEIQLRELEVKKVEAQNNLVSAEGKSEAAAKRLINAENKKKTAKDKVRKAEKKVTDAEDESMDAQEKFMKGVGKVGESVTAVKSILEEMETVFGDLTSDATSMGNAIEAMVSAISIFESIMTIVIILQTAFNIATESNPWMAIAAAVLAVAAALAGFIGAEKVRKANEEIERQQKLLDQLEHTFERLQDAAEKAFGADFVSNYNQQLDNLNAQIIAKQRQLTAEQSKGKKANKDQVKQLNEDIRDLKDEIADLYGTISEQMLGSDITSAARDFAQAWLDAYKEFSRTSDAMSDKFKEMVENMVIEAAMGKVMERALRPMFDMIDNASEEDFYSAEFWRKVAVQAETGAKAADYGANTMMQFLQQAGYSIRDLGGELTGMSREIGSATSEEINYWGAALNTQNYYIAQQLAEVRAIHETILSRDRSEPQVSITDYMDLQKTALTHLAAIEQHTAETVSECRSIAARCEEQTTLMRRVISSKGSNMGLNVMIKDWGRQ